MNFKNVTTVKTFFLTYFTLDGTETKKGAEKRQTILSVLLLHGKKKKKEKVESWRFNINAKN